MSRANHDRIAWLIANPPWNAGWAAPSPRFSPPLPHRPETCPTFEPLSPSEVAGSGGGLSEPEMRTFDRSASIDLYH